MLFQLWRQCKKIDCLLPQELYRYVRACLYFLKPCQRLCSQSLTNLQIRSYVPSQSKRKTFWRKFEKMLIVIHLSFLHVKAVVDETSVRKFTKFCKSFVGIDASQLYPYSLLTHADRSLYALGSRFRDRHIRASTKQDP